MPALVGELTWDAPLRLLAGLHALVLSERARWDDLDAALAHSDLPGLAARPIQTNEVRRAWTLLPCFLELSRFAARDDLELIELGASAGFNLLWDRYRHVYEAGAWGPEDALLALDGQERRPVPPELLSRRPRVRRRVGVDVAPVDVTTDEGALLLRSFVWPGQAGRLERLDAAIAAVRRDPPALVRGDLLELLPGLLARRADDALTIVYATAVLGYVGSERWAQVGETIDAVAAGGGRLALLWTDRPAPGVHDHWGLWLRLWPEAEPRLLLEADFHGAWLSWLGDS